MHLLCCDASRNSVPGVICRYRIEAAAELEWMARATGEEVSGRKKGKASSLGAFGVLQAFQLAAVHLQSCTFCSVHLRNALGRSIGFSTVLHVSDARALTVAALL